MYKKFFLTITFLTFAFLMNLQSQTYQQVTNVNPQFNNTFTFTNGINSEAGTAIFTDSGLPVNGNQHAINAGVPFTIKIPNGFKYYDGTIYDIYLKITPRISSTENTWHFTKYSNYIVLYHGATSTTKDIDFEIWLQNGTEIVNHVGLIGGSCYMGPAEGARPWSDDGCIYTNVESPQSAWHWDNNTETWRTYNSNYDNAYTFILGHGTTEDNRLKGGYQGTNGFSEFVLGYLTKNVTFRAVYEGTFESIPLTFNYVNPQVFNNNVLKMAVNKPIGNPLPTATLDGYHIIGWYIGNDTENILTDAQLTEYVVNDDIMLTAVFSENYVIQLPDNVDSADCVHYPEGTNWNIKTDWSSDAIVSNHNTPFVGDLDNDGHPEIVCFSKNGDHVTEIIQNNQMLVFDGVTKQLKTTITLPAYLTAYDAAAYGLVKLPSGKGLIITATYDYKLRAYDITSANPNTPYWVSDANYCSNSSGRAVNLGFADFNHDGHPEIYVRNKIYNAETGKLLAVANSGSNTASSYSHFTHVSHWKLSSPVVADLCGNNNLDLILGNEIYEVNITNTSGTEGNSITLSKQITPPGGILADGNPQVADFNNDGYLDVFISVRNTDGHYGKVYCYVWDVHNNTVSNLLEINTSFTGKSIPMISDIDNDGMLEILIQCCISTMNEKFQTYKYNPDTKTFSFMWGLSTDEDSYSNGITSFDFNQDGLLELLICDQSTVRIVNGSGKSHKTHNDTIPMYVLNTFPFYETTIMQYPVIADVDNDGKAEIVSVGSDKLNFFKSVDNSWAPTRKVWNQYMYNVTNVNNDLTIPQYQFNNATVFTDPENVARRPYNNYLQQATTIDKYGRPFYGIPDVVVTNISQNKEGETITLTVDYMNDGDNTFNAPYYITAFANQYGGDIINTTTVNVPLSADSSAQTQIPLSVSDLCQFNDLNKIVVGLNCNGVGIAQNGGHQNECDTTNNLISLDIEVKLDTFSITHAACKEYEWFDSTYTESGIYYHTRSAAGACDSIFELSLTIFDIPNVTITGDPYISLSDSATLVASGAETYEWSTGATSDTITVAPTENTTYYVVCTDEHGCSDTAYFTVRLRVEVGLPIYVAMRDTSDCHIDGHHYSFKLNSLTTGAPMPTDTIIDIEAPTIRGIAGKNGYTADADDNPWRMAFEAGTWSYKISQVLDSVPTADTLDSGYWVVSMLITPDSIQKWEIDSATYNPAGQNDFADTIGIFVNYLGHEWVYSAVDDTLKAICVHDNHLTDNNACTNPDYKNLIINAEDKNHDGNVYDLASYSTDEWTPIGLEIPTIMYEGRGLTEYASSIDAPTDCGTYKATATVSDTVTAFDDFAIKPLLRYDADEHATAFVRFINDSLVIPDSTFVNPFDSLTATVTVAEEWHFKNWTNGIGGAELSTDSIYNFRIDRDTIIYANTERDPYYIHLYDTACVNEGYYEHGFELDSLVVGLNYDTMYLSSTVYGCDSTVMLELYANPVYDTLFTDTICYGYGYHLHGFDLDSLSFTVGWNYDTINPKTIYDCDSLVFLELYVAPIYDTLFTDTICFNEQPYQLHGFDIDSLPVGMHYDTINSETVLGCDSIVYLELYVAPLYDTLFQDTTCVNEGYHLHGFELDSLELGWYYDTMFLASALGCDSTVMLELFVTPVFDTTFHDTICYGYGYHQHGFEIDSLSLAVGMNYDNINPGTILGCDSLVYLELYVAPVYDINIYDSICFGEDYNHYNFDTVAPAPGLCLMQQELVTGIGCDSIVTLELFVGEVYDITIHDTICYGNDYDRYNFHLVNPPVGTSSETQSLSTMYSCDSIVNLNLYVAPVYSFDVVDSICEGEDYNNYGLFIPQPAPGVYNVVSALETELGCDSIFNVNFKVIYSFATPDTIYGPHNVFVSTDMLPGKYRYWVDTITGCRDYHWELDNDDWLISTDRNECTITVTTPEVATLTMWAGNSCGSVSKSIEIAASYFGVDENEDINVSVYPNPSNGYVNVEGDDIEAVNVLSVTGVVVRKLNYDDENLISIDINDLPNAIYVLEIVTRDGKCMRRVTKTQY